MTLLKINHLYFQQQRSVYTIVICSFFEGKITCDRLQDAKFSYHWQFDPVILHPISNTLAYAEFYKLRPIAKDVPGELVSVFITKLILQIFSFIIAEPMKH